MNKIVLMGNPNVGKSVLFTRLTGVHVITSNYPGTTVEYTRGRIRLEDGDAELIDAPGTYSLKPVCRAEEVALEIMKEGDIIINVVDATNLERNLNLTLQLLKTGKPVIMALNLWDEALHTGIQINAEKLQALLGVPVVTTCALTGEGIRTLIGKIRGARTGSFRYEEKERWSKVGQLIQQVQIIRHKHHSIWERLQDLTIRPWTGLPLSLLILGFSFLVIRFIGESLISYAAEPVFQILWKPVVLRFSSLLGPGFLHDMLVGKLINNQIDFVQSMGLLTTALYVPLVMVYPYVIAFYLVLSLLEDSGYLPRLSVLLDSFMHKIGLHGVSIIPLILGFGCKVPGVLSSRILETKKERFISIMIMTICIPCMSQLAIIIGLVGPYGLKGIGTVFLTLMLVALILGLLLKRGVKGESPEIFLEIPPYRLPYGKALFKKVWVRLKWFVKDAVPYVMLGVVIVNLLYVSGIIDFISRIAAPFMKGFLGLPKEAVVGVIIGFLRKDVAVGMLAPLGMSMKQLIIASVVLTMYFPCIATFTVMLRELGLRRMLGATAIMVTATLAVGGLLNLIL